MPTGRPEREPLAAVAIGPDVPAGEFAFRVHAVFRGAMNLLPAGGERLVTLLPEAAAELPQAIRVRCADAFDAWGIEPGASGRCAGGVLGFGPDGGAGPRVDLRGARRSPRRELVRIDARRAAFRALLQGLVADLEAEQVARGTELRLAALRDGRPQPGLLGDRLAAAIAAVADRLRAADAAGAAVAAGGLVGLGTGLTPSGDDVLCGLLAAVRAVAPRGVGERWGEALAPALAGTNLVSATFLGCALAGHFPGALVDLAAALAGENAVADAGRCLRAVCALGHSSGTDMATGFLYGLGHGSGWENDTYAA